MRARAAGAAVFLAALLGAGVAVGGIAFEGAAGVGDPYYPKMGNTGYDVSEYDVDLRFQRSGTVKSETLISAVADTDEGSPGIGPPLGSFHLDFRGPKVTRLEVNGLEASYSREGQELIVAAGAPILDGTPFEVLVRYKGRPKQVLNPDGSRDGWTKTKDGAVAVGEPQQTPSWVPVNDHPTDKAAWSFSLNLPRDLRGIANGGLTLRDHSERRRFMEWEQPEPMASYLAFVAIGKFRIDQAQVAGIPYLGAVDRKLPKSRLRELRKRTEVAHEFMETVAGPYPFSVTGGIVDPSSLGFAMETQTRSYYPEPPNQQLVIHEVAHQWYGNSVSVNRWKEIWLNEGFATYMEWLFEEEEGGETAQHRFERMYAANGSGAPIWNPPPADPGGPKNLFAWSVYDRGALALHVLRREIGDQDFREVLLRWAQENQYSNQDTDGLKDLIEAVTGDPSPQAFDKWLYEPGKPPCSVC